MPAAKASFWLKTPEEVTPHAAKIKMEIAVKGTCGDKDVLNDAIFMKVQTKMTGAKMQKTITNDMKAALMAACDTTAAWEVFERKHFAEFPKNCDGLNAPQGAKTRVTLDAVVQRSMANTIAKVPKKINEAAFHCRVAQNDMMKQAWMESTCGRTCCRSFDKPATKRACMMIDMNVDPFGAKGAVSGTHNTKKENRYICSVKGKVGIKI